MVASPQEENVLPTGSDTLLTISSFGNMVFQARGLVQTLELIGESAQTARTINGTLIDLSAPQFRKYSSKISVGSEVYVPPLDGIFPGQVVTIDCVCSLAYPTGSIGFPKRPVISGSMWQENGYTFYRPQLVMMLTAPPSLSFDEWKNVVSWSADFEEV